MSREESSQSVVRGRDAESARPPGEADAPSDQEAVASAKAGDHEGFRILVERYQGRVYRLALRVLRDEEQARDAAQEAFLKVYRSIGRFEGRSSFYTWLYRLVLNLCLDMKRRDRSARHVEWTEEAAESARADTGFTDEPAASARDAAESGPAGDLERAEVRRKVAEAIDTLPDVQRETLVLREVDGLSYAEIAESLGISKGTVMSRLHYARKKIQKILLEEGVV